MTFRRVCYFTECRIEITSERSEADAEGLFLTHVQLVHLNDLLTERQTRLNSLNAKMAEDQVKRYEKLAATGLNRREIMSLIGGDAPKAINESEEKLDFPEWAKEQSYESWKIEFQYYKDTVLGIYKNATLISESNKATSDPVDVHKSEQKVKLLGKIRHKLIGTLKKCENDKVKDFIINSVMNNTAISGNLESI